MKSLARAGGLLLSALFAAAVSALVFVLALDLGFREMRRPLPTLRVVEPLPELLVLSVAVAVAGLAGGLVMSLGVMVFGRKPRCTVAIATLFAGLPFLDIASFAVLAHASTRRWVALSLVASVYAVALVCGLADFVLSEGPVVAGLQAPQPPPWAVETFMLALWFHLVRVTLVWAVPAFVAINPSPAGSRTCLFNAQPERGP